MLSDARDQCTDGRDQAAFGGVQCSHRFTVQSVKAETRQRNGTAKRLHVLAHYLLLLGSRGKSVAETIGKRPRRNFGACANAGVPNLGP